MQVSNSTSQGAHYTISGGGDGTPITGTYSTGFLKPGAEQEVKVSGLGPWKVQFVPEQGDRVVVKAYKPDDCVQLLDQSGMLYAEIAA